MCFFFSVKVVTSAERVMNNLHEVKRDVSKNCEDLIQEVKAKFEKIMVSLAAREKNIVSTIRKYSDIKLSRLDTHYQLLQTHHDSILEDISRVEQLIEANEGVAIVSQKQALCDQLEVHEQSILSLVEMVGNNRSFLSFKVCPQLEELGELEEYVKEPDKPFHLVRKVVVSEEEDPYNDVPLRFEDFPSDALHTEVRTDENQKYIEYEPESKPISFDQGKKPPLPIKSHSPNPPVPPKPKKRVAGHGHLPKIPPKPHYNSKASTMPNLKFTPETSNYQCSESSDEYDPIEDFSQRTVVNTPPPIPPNHPRDRPKLPPKPPKTTSVPNLSNHQYFSLPLESEIIQPLMILESKQLCRPYSNEIVYPNGVCYSKDDTLIVSDVNNDCLRLIDDGGNFIGKIGRTGRAGGQFKEPAAVAVDNNNFILVCERDNQRVQKFTLAGKYVAKFGQKTLIGNVLNDPIGIAVSAHGQIAVSDWDKSQISYFTQTGRHLATEKCQNCLKFPAGIAYTRKGNLLVVDRGNHCIWSLTKEGDIASKMGSYGNKPGQLSYPYGVTIGKDGSVIVTESGNNRISVFSEAGQFVRSFGMSGSKPGMFNHPRHVCINAKGHIVVADEMNQRIQIFSILLEQ